MVEAEVDEGLTEELEEVLMEELELVLVDRVTPERIDGVVVDCTTPVMNPEGVVVDCTTPVMKPEGVVEEVVLFLPLSTTGRAKVVPAKAAMSKLSEACISCVYWSNSTVKKY